MIQIFGEAVLCGIWMLAFMFSLVVVYVAFDWFRFIVKLINKIVTSNIRKLYHEND